MDTLALKEDLKQRLDLENDPAVLEAVRNLLNHPPLDPILKEKLISRAQKAIEDITAGRIYTKEEMILRTNRLVGK